MAPKRSKEHNPEQATGSTIHQPCLLKVSKAGLTFFMTMVAGIHASLPAAFALDGWPWQPDQTDSRNQPAIEEPQEPQPTEFTPLGQAQGTPALNVIVPGARPPLPPPPPVDLPFTAAQPTKASLAWRARASALFKTSEIDARTAMVTVTATLATLRQSLERRIQEAGLTIADEAPDGRQILFLLPFESRQEFMQVQKVAPERAILAVKPIKGASTNFEVRAQIETRNKLLTIERVKQILEAVRNETQTQLQTQNQSTNASML